MLGNQADTNQPASLNSETPQNNKTEWNGSYNRESGQKTLFFIGIIITLVTILSVISLLMINQKSSVLAQTNSIKQTTQKDQH